MVASSKKPRRAGAPTGKHKKAISPRSVKIVLTQAEKELLLKACVKYRYTIPAYIQSAQPEVDRLDAIIDKLS